MPTFTKPTDPAANVSWTQVHIWEKQVNEHMKRGIILMENLETAYSLIYGQCSDALRAKLESRPNHAVIEGAADSIGLLKNIQTVTFQFQSQWYSPLALHEVKRCFYLFQQDRHMTCQQYQETFKNNVKVIKYCRGALSKDTGLVDAELTRAGLTHANAGQGQLQDAENAARERVLACAFLFGSNRTHYGKLLEDLENDYTQGIDNYPPTLQQAYTLLVHWKQDPRNVVHLVGRVNDGVAFTNVRTDGGKSKGGRKKSEITCYRCGDKGHFAHECPSNDASGDDPNENGGNDTTATQLLMQALRSLWRRSHSSSPSLTVSCPNHGCCCSTISRP